MQVVILLIERREPACSKPQLCVSRALKSATKVYRMQETSMVRKYRSQYAHGDHVRSVTSFDALGITAYTMFAAILIVNAVTFCDVWLLPNTFTWSNLSFEPYLYLDGIAPLGPLYINVTSGPGYAILGHDWNLWTSTSVEQTLQLVKYDVALSRNWNINEPFMNGCCRSWVAVARCSGLLMRHLLTKSMKSIDHLHQD